MKNNSWRRGYEIEDSILTASEEETARIGVKMDRRFFGAIWIFSLFLVVTLVSRVVYLNVIKGDEYVRTARGNTIRSLPISAPRGKIFDRNGILLANNVPVTNVVVSGRDLPLDGELLEQMITKLSKYLSISENDVERIFGEAKKDEVVSVVLKENIDRDEALRFAEQARNFSGVYMEQTAKRVYEDSAVFSHIIGYEGRVTKNDLEKNSAYLPSDMIGRDGIEKSYEDFLRGERGFRRAETDASGNIQREVATAHPVSGGDIVLNIDGELQKKLYDALTSALEKADLQRGAAVAMNPKNGEVLALVSIPSYDNNIFSGKIDAGAYAALIQDENKPLFNRVISGEYPPGSTIKPIFACAALEEGVVTEHTQIESRGGIYVGKTFFGDWKVHGFTDIRHALAVSSDVYFYSIGGGYGGIRGMGMSAMKKYANMFGLGKLTGVDLPGEASGFIPDEQWKEKTFGEKWYIGNSYHASIGQGFIKETPMQMVGALSAIANGGILYEPQVVSQARLPNGETVSYAPKKIGEVSVNKSFLNAVREGMRMTVTEGTAQSLNTLSVAVAGKTGTAQYGPNDKTHGWFESFAPFDNPEIAMVILVEAQDEHGYYAAPVAKEVYEWYFGERLKR